ncbi:MAG: response regulator [Candidatus Hydrogenedentes bacterium]|nr:response regulator [Candidatus Hydrogenedentota bacterium]
MNRRVCALLVEDNPADAELARDALQDGALPIDLHVVGDGEQALAFVFKQNDYVTAPDPDIVLLDLNLPRLNGKEVLSRLKSDETSKSIPVIILTSSEADEDVVSSYSLGANSYVTKPLDLKSFRRILDLLKSYWFVVSKLPNTGTTL